MVNRRLFVKLGALATASFAAPAAYPNSSAKQFSGTSGDLSELISNLGYEYLGVYETGLIEITNSSQVFLHEGEYWRPKRALQLPYKTLQNWGVDHNNFSAASEISLRRCLSSARSTDAVDYRFTVDMPVRSLSNRLRDQISIRDFGAVGDAQSDDSGAFTVLEKHVAGQIVDLCGSTYQVDSIPAKNVYVNGAFRIGTKNYDADQNRTMLSSAHDTGGIGAPYTGGTGNGPSIAGRTNDHQMVVIGSQGCRSSFARSGNYSSIYSLASGNVSANIAARQCLAGAPQTVNLAAEECEALGFNGVNIASSFSKSEGTRGANIGTRLSHTSSSYNANIASNTSNAGGGWGFRGKVSLNRSDNGIASVTVEKSGMMYSEGDILIAQDRAHPPAKAARLAFTLDSKGGVLTVNIVDGGSGYSETVDVMMLTSGKQSANLATTLSNARGMNSANAAAIRSVTTGRQALNVATETCIASGDRSANVGSSGSKAAGMGALTLGATMCTAQADRSVVIGRRGISDQPGSLVVADASEGGPSTANKKFQVTANGTVTAAGRITGSTSYTDYAEFFENYHLGAIPLGTLVSLHGRKVRIAQPSDHVLGAISATALIVAGDSPFQWAGRHLLGEFDEPLYDVVAMIRWEGSERFDGYDGTVAEATESKLYIPDNAERYFQKHPRLNPDYDEIKGNVPRSERPDEWSCVGLLGQIRIRVAADVKPGQYISADKGIGVKSLSQTNLICMDIRKTFDITKGYGVALCFIR